jgi:hypothetical protein
VVSNAPLAFIVPVAAVLLVVAATGVVTARRGWTGSLRRAGKLGIHSPAAVISDEAFAVANRVAAPVVGGASAIALVLAVLLVFLPLPSAATVVIAVLTLGGVIALLLAAGVLGEKAARSVPVPARRPGNAASCAGCACGSGGCAGLTRNAVPVDSAVSVDAPAQSS